MAANDRGNILPPVYPWIVAIRQRQGHSPAHEAGEYQAYLHKTPTQEETYRLFQGMYKNKNGPVVRSLKNDKLVPRFNLLLRRHRVAQVIFLRCWC